MTYRKFLCSMVVMFLLFCVSGCGGGRGSKTSFAPDVPTGSVPTFIVTFDSNGGSYVEEQEVKEEERAIQPDDPELEGHVFICWLDEDGNNFNFDSPIYYDLVLKAEWAELDEVAEEELTELKKVVFGGQAHVSFDSSPLSYAEVIYDFADNAGFVEVSEVTDGPILNTAGLIGRPINIKSNLLKFDKTVIKFHYNPNALTVEPEDLGVVWYDEANNRMVLLSKDVFVDTNTNTVQVSSNHFSIYGVVSVSQWQEIWSKRLPTIRSEDVRYNIILAIDCSGSMRGSAIIDAIASSQSLIDTLSNEDYVAVLSFESYANEVLDTTKIENNKQRIKDSIATLSASGGTDIQAALDMSLKYKMIAPKYKNFVVLLSDGQSLVGNEVLQRLKSNSMKVIAVGVGNVDHALMERIVNATDGSYLYASSSEQLKDKFEEVANTDFGLESGDNDVDGLPDALEEAGMRDIFGREWKTDSKDEDSDDDGFKDGEELIYNQIDPVYRTPSSSISYVSNPNLATEKQNYSRISFPEKVYCSEDDISSKTLSLGFRVTSYLYEKFRDKEIFYSQAKKDELKYEVIDLPEGFSIPYFNNMTVRELTTRRTEDGIQKTEVDYYVEFSVIYPENQSRTLKTVNLRHIDNTPGGMDITYLDVPVEYVNTKVRSHVAEAAKSAYERLEAQYIKALMKEIREVQQDNSAMKDSADPLKVLAKEINATPLTLGNTAKVPAQVYQAFAEAIHEAVEDAKTKGYNVDLEKWNKNPLTCVTTFMKDWAQGMGRISVSKTQTVIVGSTSYTVDMDVTSYDGGIGNASAYVTTAGKKWLLVWASDNKKINEALGNYCAMLSQLSESVIEQFWTICINDFFKEIGSSKQVSQTMIHNAGLVIKVLCGGKEGEKAAKDLAQEALKYVNSKTQEVLKDKLQKITGKDFEIEIENFVKNLPDGRGRKFMDIAQVLKQTSKEYDELKEAIEAYASFSRGSGGSVSQAISDLEKAYSGFKSIYDKLNDEELFSDKPSLIDIIFQ